MQVFIGRCKEYEQIGGRKERQQMKTELLIHYHSGQLEINPMGGNLERLQNTHLRFIPKEEAGTVIPRHEGDVQFQAPGGHRSSGEA